MNNPGLYIHIPFCKRCCFYCHFTKQPYDAELVGRYIDALVKELKLRGNPDQLIDTVYLGGGSPSLLSEKQAASIMDAVGRNFKVADTIEATIEINPDDVDRDTLGAFKRCGFNRLSIGTQSFVQRDIDYLQRTHSAQQSLKAVETALESGFRNINVDYIIGLPTQAEETLKENIGRLSGFDIPHVSAYLLEDVEEGDDKAIRDNEHYYFVEELLEGMGYEHYEVSNFAKPGYRSAHNLKYWLNHEYIGVGVSAARYEGGVDYKNTEKLEEYFEKIAVGQLPQGETDRRDKTVRAIVTGLRLLEGVPVGHFDEHAEAMGFLLAHGLLIHRGDRVAVNPRKLLMLNGILEYFV